MRAAITHHTRLALSPLSSRAHESRCVRSHHPPRAGLSDPPPSPSCFRAPQPTAGFATTFVMILGIFFGVYGLSALMSLLVDRANAALLGTIASLVVACMCG